MNDDIVTVTNKPDIDPKTLHAIIVKSLLAQREVVLQELAGIEKTLTDLGHKVATPRRFRENGDREQSTSGG